MAFIGDLLGANCQSQTSSGHYLDFHDLKPFTDVLCSRPIILSQVENPPFLPALMVKDNLK